MNGSAKYHKTGCIQKSAYKRYKNLTYKKSAYKPLKEKRKLIQKCSENFISSIGMNLLKLQNQCKD